MISAPSSPIGPAWRAWSRVELYELLPPDRAVLIRRPLEKREWLLASPLRASDLAVAAAGTPASRPARRPSAADAPASRLGYYNAGFLSNLHDGGTWSGLPATPTARRPRPLLLVHDSEAPYCPSTARRTTVRRGPRRNEPVDGHAAARSGQARTRHPAAIRRNCLTARHPLDYHFTTFSHHNSFWPLDPEPTPQPHNKSLNVWNSTPLNLSFVDHHKLPMSPAYRAAVVASGGGATIYEAIRDHLGYRLEVRGTPTAGHLPLHLPARTLDARP